MRVLLGTAWYFPTSTGGTETHVRGLARGLRAKGIDAHVAVPSETGHPEQIMDDGVPVHWFMPESAGGQVDMAPTSWLRLVDSLQPSIVDIHSCTPGMGPTHLAAARRAGFATVFTVHVGGFICARGTLMRFGETPCDGDLAHQPCTACRLEANHVPRAVGHALTALPRGIRSAAAMRLRGPSPALSRGLLVDDDAIARRERIVRVANDAQMVVATSEWLAQMLRVNGVAAARVMTCRQGVDDALARSVASERTTPHVPFRVGFVGRLDPEKGARVLIQAARQSRPDGLAFHLWGIAQTPQAEHSRKELEREAADLPHVTFHPAPADPASIYPNIDVLAVPSLGFETGPLVVIEALASGIPVVGSNIGGIAERVSHGINGLLVPPGDPMALAHALERLAAAPREVAVLAPRGTVRTTSHVADEMHAAYVAMLKTTVA